MYAVDTGRERCNREKKKSGCIFIHLEHSFTFSHTQTHMNIIMRAYPQKHTPMHRIYHIKVNVSTGVTCLWAFGFLKRWSDAHLKLHKSRKCATKKAPPTQ